MTNMAATSDAAEKALQLPKLGVGLHFNITLGRPLSDPAAVRTLIDGEGFFYSRRVLARKLTFRQVCKAELSLELEAQFEGMLALGLSPTHIDSHQHVHSFPQCFDTVATLCEALRIPIRMPWILTPAGVKQSLAKQLKQRVLRLMLQRNEKAWQGRVQWNSGLGSIFDLGLAEQTLCLSHYKEILEAATGNAFELMVHPARDASELVGLTRIGVVSEQESRLLNDADLQIVYEQMGFTKGNYSDL